MLNFDVLYRPTPHSNDKQSQQNGLSVGILYKLSNVYYYSVVNTNVYTATPLFCDSLHFVAICNYTNFTKFITNRMQDIKAIENNAFCTFQLVLPNIHMSLVHLVLR